MKKYILFSLAALIMSASGALAATIADTSTTIGSGTFAPSTKVSIIILSASTSYAATSKHLNGTFEYGTVGGSATGDPSKVLKKALAAGTALPTSPTDATALAAGYAE